MLFCDLFCPDQREITHKNSIILESSRKCTNNKLLGKVLNHSFLKHEYYFRAKLVRMLLGQASTKMNIFLCQSEIQDGRVWEEIYMLFCDLFLS
jgi:hypothetical protein